MQWTLVDEVMDEKGVSVEDKICIFTTINEGDVFANVGKKNIKKESLKLEYWTSTKQIIN